MTNTKMNDWRPVMDPELKSMITPPKFAWPTIAMVAACYLVFGVTIAAVVAGSLPI